MIYIYQRDIRSKRTDHWWTLLSLKRKHDMENSANITFLKHTKVECNPVFSSAFFFLIQLLRNLFLK